MIISPSYFDNRNSKPGKATKMMLCCSFPDCKVHGAIMGPIWGWQVSGGPHVGPMNLAIWVALVQHSNFTNFQNYDHSMGVLVRSIWKVLIIWVHLSPGHLSPSTILTKISNERSGHRLVQLSKIEKLCQNLFHICIYFFQLNHRHINHETIIKCSDWEAFFLLFMVKTYPDNGLLPVSCEVFTIMDTPGPCFLSIAEQVHS